MFRTINCLIGLVVLAAVGCDRDAECLAKVARCAACKGEAVAAEAGSLQVIRSNLDDISLEGKVAGRLRWDKFLEGIPFTIETNQGVVELKGVVTNAEQRKRAVAIVQDTVGVEKVIDSLTTNAPGS